MAASSTHAAPSQPLAPASCPGMAGAGAGGAAAGVQGPAGLHPGLPGHLPGLLAAAAVWRQGLGRVRPALLGTHGERAALGLLGPSCMCRWRWSGMREPLAAFWEAALGLAAPCPSRSHLTAVGGGQKMVLLLEMGHAQELAAHAACIALYRRSWRPRATR